MSGTICLFERFPSVALLNQIAQQGCCVLDLPSNLLFDLGCEYTAWKTVKFDLLHFERM